MQTRSTRAAVTKFVMQNINPLKACPVTYESAFPLLTTTLTHLPGRPFVWCLFSMKAVYSHHRLSKQSSYENVPKFPYASVSLQITWEVL